MKKSKRKLSNYTTILPVKLLILAVIIVLSVLFLFPVLASIAGSFMTMTEIGKRCSEAFSNGITLIPDRIVLNQCSSIKPFR